MKKIIALFLCAGLMAVSCFAVRAETLEEVGAIEPDITVSSAYTRSTKTTIAISSGKATAFASITGYPGTTTKVKITMYLEKKGLLGLFWTVEGDWTDTFTGHYGSLSKTQAVSGGTYRVRAVYVAYGGSKSETITSYSSDLKY